MKRKIVCVFAHPDDEAFGPSGTIAKLSLRNNVYLICVTNGNDKSKNIKNLANKRKQELEKSAEILGIKKIFQLNYEDGELCNNLYHEVAKKIENILQRTKPYLIITFDQRGVSGHIDHVFCSMVSSYLFLKLPFIKSIYYYVVPKQVSNKMHDYFIYFPEGFERNKVDKIIDIRNFWNKKVEAIKTHRSQKNDLRKILSLINNLPKEEFFLVHKKGIRSLPSKNH